MERREFIWKSVLAGTAAGILGTEALKAQSLSRQTKITILHTNDMHSRIDPFAADSGKFAGMGGLARRAALIAKIRKEEANVILLDAGDIFQGTPYFNFFGGELEYKLMSRMGYDAATFGNHDFDNGLTGLEKMLPHAQFPFLSANYDFSKTSLANRFKPYKIIKKAGLKVGIFGLGIELYGLVPESLYGKVVYQDPIAKATEMAERLKNEGCSLVICLSHLGYQYEGDKISDKKLATFVNGIDLIIGGHTHTFLDKPDVLKSPNGAEVLVNQVGWAGINLGRIDYFFGSDGKQTAYNPAVIGVGLA